MATDPFQGPSNDPDPDRPRPEVTASYDGECFCGLEFYDGDLIRATADGAGWEAVDHDHDPEESAPSETGPVEVGRTPLPAPPEGLYAVPAPTDTDLYAALGSGHPEVEDQASTLLSMTMEERAAFLNPVPAAADDRTAPAQFSCPECPKTFAPTKDQRVRTHKRTSDGERCSGSRAVPVELVDAAVADLGEPGPLGDQAMQTLTDAVPSAAAVAARQRVERGRGPGPNPHRPPLSDPFAAAAKDVVTEAERLLAMGPAPSENAPHAAHVEYDRRLDAALEARPETLPAVPEKVHTITTVAPGAVPAVQEEGPRAPEPEALRDRYNRYILPHPVTGRSQAWRRATTFAGVLDDTYNLDLWQKRHLVRGAAMAAAKDPGRLVPAARLDVKDDKQILNDLAEVLMEESGSNTAAEQGTYVHALTEDLDRSATPEQRNTAWAAVPDHYRADVTAYGRALDQAGFRVVPSMLERRTAVVEFGVAGTFDQVLQLIRDVPGVGRPGEYVIGDKKTGSDMSYGQGTHAVQLSLYAHGLNSSGVWDGHANRWVRSVPVREDVGIIIHIPLQGGDCTLHVLDLTVGWAAAQLAHRVFNFRSVAKAKGAKSISRVLHTVHVDPLSAVQPTTPKESAPVQASQTAAPWTPEQRAYWGPRMQAVRSKADASVVFREMVTAGLTEAQRAEAISFMNQILATAPGTPQPMAVKGPAPVIDWRARAASVTTKPKASALVHEMVAAGVPEPVHTEVVDSMVARLMAAPPEAPAGTLADPPADVLSAAYWTPIAMGVTTRAQASGVFGSMTAAGVHDDVKAEMVQRMTDWLASQEQATAIVTVAQVPAGVPLPAPAQPVETWEVRADRVQVQEQASAVYRGAQQDPAMTADRLTSLVARMKAALENEPPF